MHIRFTNVCVEEVEATIAEDDMEVLLCPKSRRKYTTGYAGINPEGIGVSEDLLMEWRVCFTATVLAKARPVRLEIPRVWCVNLPCALKKITNVWGGPRHESLILRRRLTSGRCLLTG